MILISGRFDGVMLFLHSYQQPPIWVTAETQTATEFLGFDCRKCMAVFPLSGSTRIGRHGWRPCSDTGLLHSTFHDTQIVLDAVKVAKSLKVLFSSASYSMHCSEDTSWWNRGWSADPLHISTDEPENIKAKLSIQHHCLKRDLHTNPWLFCQEEITLSRAMRKVHFPDRKH